MEVKEFLKDLYVIDNGHVRCFLIVGKENALLIDTLFKQDDVFSEVKKLTDNPVTVVLTHGDGDHFGGVAPFKECYLHHNDFDLVKEDVLKHAVKENDTFDVGDYHFQVIEIPGHTNGSIALFDKEKGLLISGDSLQKEGPIFMFGEHRDLDKYIESHKKLLAMKDEIKTVLPSHHEYPIDNSYIEKNLLDAIDLKDGKLEGVKTTDRPCLTYTGKNGTSFYFN